MRTIISISMYSSKDDGWGGERNLSLSKYSRIISYLAARGSKSVQAAISQQQKEMSEEHQNNNVEQSNLDDDQSGESGEDIANQIGRQATRQNIKVVCRIRPTNDKEIQNNGVDVLTHDHESIELKNEDYDLQFTFDRVFGKETSQVDMFEKCAKPLIADIFAGYNATIFAYGQTGTGKTFTMEGNIEDDLNKGIIPRSIEGLFDFIAESDDTIEFTIKVSYVEIYMERIRDLLDNTRTKVNLTIREHKTAGIYIADVTEEYVTSVKGILRLMQIGARNRSVAATGMNEGSSRSHSVFTVTVSQKNVHTAEVKTGKLVLVDLAGSEMVKKTNSSGQQLEEAKTINKSLSALGLVINALTDEKSTHIPYRDSKLTRLLQDSLGGNSKTVLIIAVSPSSYNAMETVSTLRFGMRAKSIENKVEVNRTRTVEMLEALLEKAELAIDKQNTMIATLKARLDAALASQHQEAVAEHSAMEQLQEVIDKLNNELTEEREYSNKLCKKLEEVKLVSDSRRALIEEATAMLEAIQKTNLMLAEQVETLKSEKAILTAELEKVKATVAEESSKLKFELKEKDNHIEALNNEMTILKEDNSGLKEKLAATTAAHSTPRIRSINFGNSSILDNVRCDTPSSLHSAAHSLNSVGIALFPDEASREQTMKILEVISEAEQSSREESCPKHEETAVIVADKDVHDEQQQEQLLSDHPTEIIEEPSNYSIPDLPKHDRDFDRICEDIVTSRPDISELVSPAVAAMVLEQFAMGELMSTSQRHIRIALAGEDLRTALRDRFDDIQNVQNELQSKCDVLEIEKQELNKKIEQRDERIKELEATTSDLYSQMFDKTKNHTQEMDALRSLIQTLKLEHQQEIEELRKSKPTTPLIKADELDPSPRTIRGGGGGTPSQSRSFSFQDDEMKEKRLSDRRRSLDLLGPPRHESSGESPLLLGGSISPNHTNTHSTSLNAIATEDSLEPQKLVLPASPPRTNSNNGRPPRQISIHQSSQSLSGPPANQSISQSGSIARTPSSDASSPPTSSPPTKPSSQPGSSPPTGPTNQGNACCVIS